MLSEDIPTEECYAEFRNFLLRKYLPALMSFWSIVPGWQSSLMSASQLASAWELRR